MTFDLGDGRNAFIHAHTGQVWLTSYNGQGVVNPLTPDQAMELGLAMFRMARQMKQAGDA